MKLLLTGSTGFVGRNFLLAALREKRYEAIYVPVRSLEKLKGQFLGDGFPGIPETVHPIVTEAPRWNLSEIPTIDHVVHSAGIISGQNEHEYFDCNVEGTRTLLPQVSATAKIVVLSSMSAVGPCADGVDVNDERSEARPVTWYGQSKLAMEVMLAKEFSHLNYLCLRPPMILGPRDQATLPLFKMVRQPVRFKPGFRPKLYSFIAVEDLVTAIFSTLDSGTDWKTLPQRVFFVASDVPISDSELIRYSGEALARKGMVVSVPQPLLWGVSRIIDSVRPWRNAIPNLSVDRAKEIWPDRWVVSSQAFRDAFRWQSNKDLKATLKDTSDWYVKTGQLRV